MPSYDTQDASRRSRSPTDRAGSKRTRSPHSHSHHRHHHHHHTSKRSKLSAPVTLPFEAPTLSKYAYEEYKPMFGLYLDIQKHIVLEDLPDEDVRGRWKSFLGKWNREELAEGWYDPATLQKAQTSAASNPASNPPNPGLPRRPRGSPKYGSPTRTRESSDDDLVGPTLPGQNVALPRGSRRPGPAIPNLQDLELKRELEQENSQLHHLDLRHDRKLDRKAQKDRLDEIAPRAEAGSKDRMLEKKREKADSNRAFASAKTEGGGVEEVPESDLLGDEDGGIEGFKKQKSVMERKKNERELRKEEILRARGEEREERIREYKAKEEKTMSGLVALAKARFG